MEKSLSSSLVVEGNILKGDTTVIRLSRVSAVSERTLFTQTGASIRVEGDDNSTFNLSETEPGVYKVNPINLIASTKYRLKISANGKEYESEWTTLINTAEIDTVYWERKNGVEIFIKSSGNKDDNRYYKWDYDEVWDFNSPYTSPAYYTYLVDNSGKRIYQCIDKTIDGDVYNLCMDWYDSLLTQNMPCCVGFNDTMFHCWKYQNSTNINIGSTAALAENVMLAPVRKLDDNGFELSSLYSILVKQTALSKETYEFYKLLKGNSESMGTIFDAQPSQMKTNLRCTSDPNEIVIGYTSTTSVRTKRLFISVKELPEWHYFPNLPCTVDTVIAGVSSRLTGNAPHPEQIRDAVDIGQIPFEILNWEGPPAYRITKYLTISAQCVDCRERGEHRKPDFWPN